MKLHSEVDIDIETLHDANDSRRIFDRLWALYEIRDAVINGLEDKKIFESYRREQDPCKEGE